MPKPAEVKGVDVPFVQLQPLNERKAGEQDFKRLVASIRSAGLIEPLCVYNENGRYVILDGYLRYLACKELGVETIPCLVYKTKEAYSFDKMVSRLSPIQENRMLKSSLETLDEQTIARALGLVRLRDRLKKVLLSKLAPEVAKEYDAERINRSCAESMIYVKPERQIEILKEMVKAGDFSAAFARAMVIRTPAKLRAKLPTKSKSPWDQEEKKQDLLKRFTTIQGQYDFYTALFRQYVADLVKLSVYIRRVTTNDRARAYLEVQHPEILKLFNTILLDAGDAEEAGAAAAPAAGG